MARAKVARPTPPAARPPLRYPLLCRECGAFMGSVSTPTADELRGALASSPFSMLAGMIPPDAFTAITAIVVFRCVVHTTQEDPDNGSTENESHGDKSEAPRE